MENAPPLWEWLLAAAGVLLIVGVMSAMIYRGAVSGDRPPAFELSVGGISRSGDGYVATFKVRNLGAETAANLGVEGKLTQRGQEVETAATSLTYIPGDSEREGGLFFRNDPGQFELELRATGYEKP